MLTKDDTDSAITVPISDGTAQRQMFFGLRELDKKGACADCAEGLRRCRRIRNRIFSFKLRRVKNVKNGKLQAAWKSDNRAVEGLVRSAVYLLLLAQR